MTWEIFLGIITAASFIVTIGKVVSSNTAALTRLQGSIDKLEETINKQERDINEIDENVQEHEVRISILEAKE